MRLNYIPLLVYADEVTCSLADPAHKLLPFNNAVNVLVQLLLLRLDGAGGHLPRNWIPSGEMHAQQLVTVAVPQPTQGADTNTWVRSPPCAGV
ncbi:MAG TPA: hypothetical protein VNH82_04275 [Candidatus Dormibacteraeota bacterium]|nr:hypothetical protein [Candidatus Dormibacteraeota bacterium]